VASWFPDSFSADEDFAQELDAEDSLRQFWQIARLLSKFLADA
jgi:hypothetical protein